MRERETLKEHKNYLPALLLTIVFWAILFLMVWKVDPSVVADFPIRGSYGIFFLIGFLAVWFLTSLVLGNRQRGLWIAISFVIYGYLRLMELDSWINLILLLALLVGVELYSRSNKPGRQVETKKEQD